MIWILFIFEPNHSSGRLSFWNTKLFRKCWGFAKNSIFMEFNLVSVRLAFMSGGTSFCYVHFLLFAIRPTPRSAIVFLLLFDFTRASFSFTASSFFPPSQCHQLFWLGISGISIDYWSHRIETNTTIQSFHTWPAKLFNNMDEQKISEFWKDQNLTQRWVATCY